MHLTKEGKLCKNNCKICKLKKKIVIEKMLKLMQKRFQ